MFYLDQHTIPKNYFSGIAYGQEKVVLSLSGLIEYCAAGNDLKSLLGGRYSLVFHDAQTNSTVVQVDPTGQDCIFLYEKNGFWALSNSLYKLVEELKDKGVLLDVYYPALNAYKVKHSLGNQPITNNTIIDGIKILARDTFIRVNCGIASINKINTDEVEIHNNSDYVTHLHSTLNDLSAVLKSIQLTLPEGNLRCDLTGGLDSRAVFAIANNANVINKSQIVSNKKFEDDYLLANYIAQAYGGELSNDSLPQGVKLPNNSFMYELYKYGNAGVYTQLYKPRYLTPPNALHLHGAGGESLRGQYSGTPRQIISRLKKYFENDFDSYSLVKTEFLNYFYNKDIDVDDTKSMLHHSRNFRARFHFGRNWFRGLSTTIFSPLCDIRLESLSNYIIKQNDLSSMSIFYHIYLLLDKNLAFFPFDDSTKNMNIDQLKAGLNIINTKRPLKDDFFKNYKVYGVLGDNAGIDVNCNVSDNRSFIELVEQERKNFSDNNRSVDLQWASDNLSIVSILNLLN